MKRLIPLAVLLTLPAAAKAEELLATVTRSGREVQVQVRHPDGEPAAGVNVRLLLGRQLTVAVARTDARGRWTHTVGQSGAYEAVVEAGPDAEDAIRLPFTVLDDAEAAAFPWVIAGPGVGCLLAAAVLFVFGLHSTGRRRARLGPIPTLAAAVLLLAGGGLLGWSAWGSRPGSPPPDPDVADAAREFLRGREVAPLSAPLTELLADTSVERVPTQPHPLLDRPAPEFELADHRRRAWRLHERLDHGPVVLVFYYGYHCNHCVGQLFALHDDMAKFRELSAEVLAVSADPPDLTQARFRQYGEFAFPVLSDPGNRVAQEYGVYRPPSGQAREELQHGTFVIGRDGRVRWAQHGNEPFTGNLTLLHELARLEGRLPGGAR